MMKYTHVKNPQWANAEHTVISCEVNFDNLSEEFVPFGAVASGDEKHTHEIYARCVAKDFGAIAEYVAPPVHVPTYKEARALAYAPLAEQLDMQYHDTMNGTETWLDHIRSVKEAHPKEGE